MDYERFASLVTPHAATITRMAAALEAFPMPKTQRRKRSYARGARGRGCERLTPHAPG